ncbi:MAG: hypothetical protein VW879_01920 [Opitutae bacterium]
MTKHEIDNKTAGLGVEVLDRLDVSSLPDYKQQKKIVTETIDRVMGECGAVSPVLKHLLDAREELGKVIEYQHKLEEIQKQRHREKTK